MENLQLLLQNVTEVEAVILVEEVVIVAKVDAHSVHTANLWDTPKIHVII